MTSISKNNPEFVIQTLGQQARLRKLIREFFDARNFTEVQTPIAVKSPGVEVHLHFFQTKWLGAQGGSQNLFLRTSPELQLKRLLGHGLKKVYEIGSCFRNVGEISDWHHPEFTMLEWYEVGSNLNELMDLTEQLIHHCYINFHQSAPPTITRHTVSEAFLLATGVELRSDDVNLNQKLRSRGCISIRDNDDFETAFHKAMLDQVEPWLRNQAWVFLSHFPPSTAALAQLDGGYAERFECYAHGIELCNGFQELLGKEENQNRCYDVSTRRKSIYGDSLPLDPNFWNEWGTIRTPTTGIAMGFERFLALMLEQKNLRKQITLPMLSIND